MPRIDWIRSILKIQKEFADKRFLSSDPLEIVHRFKDPVDQELIAVFASMLSYGNAQLIRGAIERFILISKVQYESKSLEQFIQKTNFGTQKTKSKFSPLAYRFHRSEDILELLQVLQASLRKHGSIGSHFLAGFDPAQPNFANALNQFTNDLKAQCHAPTNAVLHSLSSPQGKSACKRWCMLLRWMVRKDDLDLGLWSKPSGISPAHLVIPLDTHVFRNAQLLELTKRKTPGWEVAIEITEKLKQISPQDPVQFDFALSRGGILDTKSKMKAFQ